jgi:hypothetical protein
MSADANIPARKRRTSFKHRDAFERAVLASDLPAAQKLVLWSLAVWGHYRLGYGAAWPSVVQITRDTGLSRRSVQRALQALRGSWVEIREWSEIEGIQAQNLYILTRPDLTAPSFKIVRALLRWRPGYAHPKSTTPKS